MIVIDSLTRLTNFSAAKSLFEDHSPCILNWSILSTVKA